MMHVVRLPDVGEGVAEAELVDWHVDVGDAVTPDTVLAEVLTDKATVEIYAPVAGVVAELHGAPGDILAVGGDFVTLTTTASADAPTPPAPAPADASQAPDDAVPAPTPAVPADTPVRAEDDSSVHAGAAPEGRARASPAVRARARALGVDLGTVAGSGPDGQVVHADLDRVLTRAAGAAVGPVASAADRGVRVEPVRGIRRKIAERLTAAWTEIPHITFVDAVDATELVALRTVVNEGRADRRLTLLPFIARAVVLAAGDQPRLNAHYDAAAGTLSVFEAVHVGIATQTPDGLVVPVVRNAQARGLADLAAEISRVADLARAGKASRDELGGSSITISSLGALGGLVTTPILNAPEVSIIGINKLETRPVWRDGAFVPRQVFNISSSFDHRIVDGWDAATFVQRVKSLLETPALLFTAGSI